MIYYLALTVLGFNLILALIVLASFTHLLDFGKNLFDLVDYTTGTYTMGAMILGYCIFMGWRISPRLLRNLHNNKFIFKAYFRFVLKWLTPAVLIILFFSA